MMKNPGETRVCVIGLGYIGLPTASLLANRGFAVRGVDVDPRAVAAINRNEAHIAEPGLDILVRSAVESGRLRAFAEPAPADVFIIAVPTPLTAEHRPDVSYVEAATKALAPHLAAGDLVIIESTSPVGTTDRICRWLSGLRPDLALKPAAGATGGGSREPVYVAYCPERVLPGQILRELVDNDRIVGGVDEASTAKAGEFYRTFVNGEVLVADARTAEMVKLTENAFRDVNLAFANELSLVCEPLGVDVWELIRLANRHPRVEILRPGPGVGGHCIPVDPWFIIDAAGEAAQLLLAAREVNRKKTRHVVAQVRGAASRFAAPVVACLGLAYKPDVGDLRESPAVEIVRGLAAPPAGALLAVEPNLAVLPEDLAKLGVELVTLDAALARADVLVALVRHRQFADLPPPAESPLGIVIDICGLWR